MEIIGSEVELKEVEELRLEELSDEELNQVAGGGPGPKQRVNCW